MRHPPDKGGRQDPHQKDQTLSSPLLSSSLWPLHLLLVQLTPRAGRGREREKRESRDGSKEERDSAGHGWGSRKDCEENGYGEPVRSEQGRYSEALGLAAGKPLPSTYL